MIENIKSVEPLTVADFQAHPVLEFLNDDEIGEMMMQPVEELPVERVLETDAGRIIAGGDPRFEPLTKSCSRSGEIAAKAPRLHAEVTALNKAANIGATPTELAVTRTICPECAAFIESLEGKLTSPTTAVFPRR